MFEITAKDYEVRVRNFAIPFLDGGDLTISLYALESGVSFWYEKNNPAAWTLLGTVDAYSPGITLEKPQPLQLRSGTYYGFDPIIIPAGTTKGVYITIEASSTTDNLIGTDRKTGSACSADWGQPFNFPVWAENHDMAVSEGIAKNQDWSKSYGTSNQAYRFIGSIYYDSARPADEVPTSSPTEDSLPTLSPSGDSLATLSPTEDDLGVFLDRLTAPLSSPIANAEDGVMFEVHANGNGNVAIHNLELVILSSQEDLAFQQVTLAVYTSPGGLYDYVLGDAIAREGWTERGTAQVYASSNLAPEPLPEDTFDPILIPTGTTMGIFVLIKDPLFNHKILTLEGTEPLLPLSTDFSNGDLLVRQGIAQIFEPCLDWGATVVDYSLNPRPRRFYGSIVYEAGAPSAPTMLPTISSLPSASLVPSHKPSMSFAPTPAPMVNPATTSFPIATGGDIIELVTPEGEEEESGSDAHGVMFDITAEVACEIYSVELGQMNPEPMNINVYTRRGSHYHVYDDISQWELIAVYTNYSSVDSDNLISIPAQFVGTGWTRAFYIAVVETYGQTRPIWNALLAGENYRDGVWAQDDVLTLYEGLKFNGITADRPMGDGVTSGASMLEGPGGTSFNMKAATIRYRPVATITPSVSPSISQLPTLSRGPTVGPSFSKVPSQQPSVSFKPSEQPSVQPSTSLKPSQSPSAIPSNVPSISVQPSENPSISASPSSQPSVKPSVKPSLSPSESPSISFQPSDTPSMSPSDPPSVSKKPSLAPSISVMPTMERFSMTSSSSGTPSAAYGVMFEVVAARAMTIKTFWIATYSTPSQYTVHLYTKPDSWDGAENNPSAWVKLGEQVFSAPNQNVIKLSSQLFDSVTLKAQEKQSFYIAIEDHFFMVRSESMGSASIANEGSIFTGVRKYPYDDLFSTGNQRGFRFQGEVLFEYGIDPPSVSPSMTPSFVPTVSYAPTAPLTTHPTSKPSISVSPTKFITLAPTPRTESTLQIKFTSRIRISGWSLPETAAEIATVVTVVAPSLAALAAAELNSSQRGEVHIVSINGVAVDGDPVSFTGLLRSRRLQEEEILDIEYEVILISLCENDSCDNAREAADALYETVTESMREKMENGEFADALEETINDIDVALDLAIVSGEFGDLTLTILALLSIWYPTWTDGSYCSNDGGEPLYMKRNAAAWLYDTRDGCCSRYYSYDYAACMGDDNLGPIGYYPAWDGQVSKCRNDTNVPDYMRYNPSNWVYDDIDSCCERYYPWDKDNCIVESGGDQSATYTSKWFVNHADEICEMDCPEDVNVTCGGAVESWKDTFDSAEDCCENRLSWVSASYCESQSKKETPTGSSKFYVNYEYERCVQDCDSSANATCGGIVTQSHVVLHDSAEACCSDKLGWIPTEQCQAESTNTATTYAGSNQWYVNHKLGKCVQDCTGSSPCGGLAFAWDERFTSSGDCCTNKLWWVDTSDCILT